MNKKISDQIKELINTVEKRAFETRSTPMLAHTHGQPATPTTIGKELEVFVYRWRKIAKKIGDIEITGKFSGAVGNYAAHIVAYPDVDWITISKEFVESLGLEYNPLTKIYYSIGTDSVKVNLDIKNSQYLYVYKHKEYKNKKSFIKRLLTFDWKKTTKYKYNIVNTNDVIKTDGVRVVETIN